MQTITNSEAYFAALAGAMRQVFLPSVDRIVTELLRAYHAGSSVYTFGNGGSAATASHFACDLGKGTARLLPLGARRFHAVSLTDNVSVMTAWANDSSYEEIFAEQLQNVVKPDDVVLAISGSGNSPNILKALQVALSSRAYTIGLTGFRGGRMKPLCRTCLVVPSDNMEVIEDVHLAACHAIATVVRNVLRDAYNSTAPEEPFDRQQSQPIPVPTRTPMTIRELGFSSAELQTSVTHGTVGD